MKIENAIAIHDSPPEAMVAERLLEVRSTRARSAQWHSAVSQVGNLHGFPPSSEAPLTFQRQADCQSAIRQIINLRYNQSPATRHQH